MVKKMITLAAVLLGGALLNTTASSSGRLICKGQYKGDCPPGSYWLECSNQPTEFPAARAVCAASGGVKQGPTALSMRQGHQCGYIIWEVVCNNDAQNPAAQNGGGGASGNSTSEPKISAGFQGAYLFAYATNTENRSYVCNFSYTISYDDDEDDDLRDTKLILVSLVFQLTQLT